jgi:hypothetical protein
MKLTICPFSGNVMLEAEFKNSYGKKADLDNALGFRVFIENNMGARIYLNSEVVLPYRMVAYIDRFFINTINGDWKASMQVTLSTGELVRDEMYI